VKYEILKISPELTVFILSVAPVSCSSVFLVLLIKQLVFFMQKKCAMESSRMARDTLAEIGQWY